MKKILFLLSFLIGVGAFAQTSQNAGFTIAAQQSVDGKQYKVSAGKHVPYLTSSEVLSTIVSTRRHVGQIFFVENGSIIEVWQFVGGIANINLVKILPAAGGSGVGISELGTGYGLVKVNDSTYRVDTTLIQKKLTLTTFGTSGNSTLVGNTLNIPNYNAPIGNTIYTNVNLLGSIYNANTWANLDDFTINGATVSVVANVLSFSAGAGTFTQTLDLDSYTNLEKWKMTAKIKAGEKSGTSYGFGLGIRSTNDVEASSVVGHFDMTSAGTSGIMTLNSGASYTNVGSTPTGISFSVNDYILLTVERNVDSIRISAFNYTTKSAIQSVSYAWNLMSAPYIHNTGHFAIYSRGGAFTVDSLSIESNEVIESPLMIIGDSKLDYLTSTWENRVGRLLDKKIAATVTSAGPGDRTIEVKDRLPEIVALAPKNVVLLIGSNDPRNSIDSNVTKANYANIVNTLHAAGIAVWHSNLLYETAIDQSVLKNYIERTYSADSIIRTYDDMASHPGTLNVDGIHPTDYGHEVMFNSILSSRKISIPDQSSLIPVANSAPENDNVYINSLTNRLNYKSNGYWYKVAVSDSTSIDGLTSITFPVNTDGTLFSASRNWKTTSLDATYGHTGLSLLKLPSGVNGWIQFVWNTADGIPVFGFDLLNTETGFASFDAAINIDPGNGQMYIYESGSPFAVGGAGLANGDVVKLNRTGSTVSIIVNGVTRYISAFSSSADLFIKCDFNGVATTILRQPRGSGIQ